MIKRYEYHMGNAQALVFALTGAGIVAFSSHQEITKAPIHGKWHIHDPEQAKYVYLAYAILSFILMIAGIANLLENAKKKKRHIEIIEGHIFFPAGPFSIREEIKLDIITSLEEKKSFATIHYGDKAKILKRSYFRKKGDYEDIILTLRELIKPND